LGDRAALFRAAIERIDFDESKFSNGIANRVQFSLGECTVDISVFQTARHDDNPCRVECDDADQFVCNAACTGAGSRRTCERDSQEVSEILRIPRAHPFQQLFHDHDLSDAVALARVQLDMGPADCNCVICIAGVVDSAFWVDAVEEVKGVLEEPTA